MSRCTWGRCTWGRWTSGAWHRSLRMRASEERLEITAACGWVGPTEEACRGTESGPDLRSERYPDGTGVANVCAYCRRVK
jgi:hypothetical protein